MTSGLPDWMQKARTQRFGDGGAPNELGTRSSPPGVGGDGRAPYGTPRGDTHTPYAVGGPGPTASTTHAPAPPDGAAVHYLPGSPATAHLGSDGRRRPGLVALAALLVLGSLAYLVWHSVTWLEPLVESLDHCSVDRGMACFTGEPFQRWVYLPVLTVVLTWGFASGAATEGRQGRARGYLYVLAGIAALVVAGLVSGQ